MADPYLRVHAVNIYVKDQARSLDFYLNTLGFQIAFDARVGSGERLLAVAPPDGTAVLTLIEAKPNSPQARLVGRATQVAFVTEDLPTTYTEWRRRGVRFRSAAPARSNGSSRRHQCWECSPRGSAEPRSSGSPLEIFWRSTRMALPRPSTPTATSSAKDGSSRRCTRIVTCRQEI